MFKKSLEQVDKLIAAEKGRNGTAVYGINAMADLSGTKFETEYLRNAREESPVTRTKVAEVQIYEGDESSVDWTGKLTTPVKNQGSCGSCW